MPRDLTPAGRARVEEVARTHLARGWHSGAQVAVYLDGAPVLDLRLGTAAGADARLLWFSATKPLTAAATLMLVERGQIALDTPIAEVWPAFAAGGKRACTVRHVLTHRGGFPAFPPDFDWARIDDWGAAAAATAALPARWTPGAEVGYHPVTYGFALGEVIRRVDGRTPRDFLAQEVFGPLGMDASLGLAGGGLGGAGLDGAAGVRFVPPRAMSEVTFEDPEGIEARTSDIVRRFTLPSTLRGQLPAANAVGTAEALARFMAMLAGGGVLSGGSSGGVRLLRPDTVAAMTSVQAAADLDRTSGLPSSYGLGLLAGGIFAPFDRPGVFGHGGQQCTIAFADAALGLGAAYVTDGLHDPLVVQLRTEEFAQAVFEACGA